MARQEILNENGSPVLPTRATLGQEANREMAQPETRRHSKRSKFDGRFAPVIEHGPSGTDSKLNEFTTRFPLVQKPTAQPRGPAHTGLASMGIERHGKSTENESGFGQP